MGVNEKMLRDTIMYFRKQFEKGTQINITDSARELNISEESMRLLIAQMVQMGYLEEECHVPGEDEVHPITCRGCPSVDECSVRDTLGSKLYRPTEKMIPRQKEQES